MAIPDLPLMEDLWGRIVRDAYRDPTVTYVIRRDDGFLDPDLLPAESELSSEVPLPNAEALSLAHGRVLDLGCGPGRFLLWLQQRGLEVVGIDASPGALEVAGERGARDVRLMWIDELDFPSASFDTALFMGNTLGLGGGIAIVAERLARLHPLLRPGACLIATICEPEATDRPVHRAYHAMRERQGRYPGELRIRLEYAGHTGGWFDFALVNAASIEQAAKETGWRVAQLLGSDQRGVAVLARL